MMGGISKRALAGSHDEIEAAIDRVVRLVAEGGYIPLPDHRVPPDVPLENYIYYLKGIRQRVTGPINRVRDSLGGLTVGRTSRPIAFPASVLR